MDKKRLQRRNFLHRKRYNCLRQTDVGKKRRKRVIRRPSAAKTRFNKQKEYIFKVVLKNILLFFLPVVRTNIALCRFLFTVIFRRLLPE